MMPTDGNSMAIFAALHWECRPFVLQLRDITRQRLGDYTVWRGFSRQPDARREIWVIKTGAGLQRARAAARSAQQSSHFDLFLSTGCAGALRAALLPGDLAVATTVIGNPSRECFETDFLHRQRTHRTAATTGLRTTLGPILSSPHVLATGASKRDAAARTGAVAVEMEGAAIAAAAAEAGIPFVAVRAILDRLDTELGETQGFIDQNNGTIRPLALAAHLARHPGLLPQLLALQRMMQAAQASLRTLSAALLAGT